MLFKLIRKHLRVIFIFILIFMIVPFLFWGMSSYTRQGGKEEEVSYHMPSGKKVSRSKLAQAYKDGRLLLIIDIVEANNITWEQYGMYQNWINQLLKSRNPDQTALQQLILEEEARSYGLVTSRKETAKWLEKFPLFQRNGQFDMEIYQTILANLFNTWPARFEKTLTRVLTVKKLRNLILDSVFVSTEEAFEVYKERNEKVVLYHTDFDAINYMGKTGTIEKEKLVNYYNKHKEEFREPEKIKIAYLIFDPENVKENIEITPEEIEKYYKENQDEFKGEEEKIKGLDEVRDKINETLIKEKAKDITLELALETSVSLTEEKRLGDMRTLAKEKGWEVKETKFISKNQFIPELGWASQFIQTVWDMDPEALSNLINVGDKWAIASPIEKKPSYIPELSEVEAQATERLKKEKAEELAYKDAEETLNKLPKKLPFTMASKSLGLEITKTKPVTKQHPLGKAAFEGMKGPVKTPTGSTLYSVRKFYFVEPLKWEEEKKEFTKKYLEEKKRRFLNEWMQSLLKEVARPVRNK